MLISFSGNPCVVCSPSYRIQFEWFGMSGKAEAIGGAYADELILYDICAVLSVIDGMFARQSNTMQNQQNRQSGFSRIRRADDSGEQITSVCI
jgi:hypothetical protein